MFPFTFFVRFGIFLNLNTTTKLLLGPLSVARGQKNTKFFKMFCSDFVSNALFNAIKCSGVMFLTRSVGALEHTLISRSLMKIIPDGDKCNEKNAR